MDELRWGIIGCGEVGSVFAQQISRQVKQIVRITDPLIERAPPSSLIQRRLADLPIQTVPDVASLVKGCDVVLSLVTPSAADEVANQAATVGGPGLFIDFNSVSPEEKRRLAARFRDLGYVDGAILGSIAGEGARVPIALSGPRSGEAHASLRGAGFLASVVSDEVGGASALKMCRSIFMKGVECLFVETLLAAAQFGISEPVLDSIEETFARYTPRSLAEMLVTTHALHCRRRSSEMRQVVKMLGDADLPFRMSKAAEDTLLASHQTGLSDYGANRESITVEGVVDYLAHFHRGGLAT